MYKKRVGKGKVGSNSCSYLLQFFVKSFVNKSSNKTPNLMVPVKYEARFKNWTNSLLVEQVFTEFKSDFFSIFNNLLFLVSSRGK